jgi:ABC-type glycerol-3-phosphate transport system substrate-binding protein
MFKNAKQQEEAKKFFQYMCNPDLSKEWAEISGNVSPFANIANDPKLTEYEWYQAMLDQSSSQIHVGWDYGIVPGCWMADTAFTQAVVDIASNGVSPEDALATMAASLKQVMEDANQNAQ